jgi:hypothetical protein
MTQLVQRFLALCHCLVPVLHSHFPAQCAAALLNRSDPSASHLFLSKPLFQGLFLLATGSHIACMASVHPAHPLSLVVTGLIEGLNRVANHLDALRLVTARLHAALWVGPSIGSPDCHGERRAPTLQ